MTVMGQSLTEHNKHTWRAYLRGNVLIRPFRVALRIIRSKRMALRVKLDPWLVNVCRQRPMLASLYYSLWDRSFYREHRAMLQGRYRYALEVDTPSASSALLRRNIHRLEKGLLMRPRRDTFALDHIEETVDIYMRIVSACASWPGYDDAEVQWAHDVLKEYFEVTVPHPRSDAARERFHSIKFDGNINAKLVPYARDFSDGVLPSYEQLFALAKRRRSVRWFQSKPVPREFIDNAIRIASESPSACNRQPFQFRIFDDPELVRQVASLPMGTPGFDHNIPVIAVVVGRLRSYFDERDRHLIYIDASLATMAFLFALEAQGLSSCCINWPDVEEREVRMDSLLKLDPDERPVMCIAIGYPDPEGLVAYSHKKLPEHLRRFNHESM